MSMWSAPEVRVPFCGCPITGYPFRTERRQERKGDKQIGSRQLYDFQTLRTCIHNRGMPDGRGFFPPDKEIFRSHTGVWQGKATQYGGKKTAQTAFNGCEYGF